MAETETIDRAKSRKVQVASLPPGDSGRGFARLPEKLMKALNVDEGVLFTMTTSALDGLAVHARVTGTNGLLMFNGIGSFAPNGQPIPTPGRVDNYAGCFWANQFIPDASAGFWYLYRTVVAGTGTSPQPRPPCRSSFP